MSTLRDILLLPNPGATLRKLDASGTLAELDPALAALRMEIPTGYHHKDNLTHSIQVLDNAIAREIGEPDLILRAAALFHDIGKPATRKFHKQKLVTFDGHESVGAYQITNILKAHNFTKKEINEIRLLIAYHMRSHGFTSEQWTDSAVRRLIADAETEETLNRLIIIFYADITTKFDSKRNKLYESVDALVAVLEKVKTKDARKALRPAVNGNEIMELFNLKPGKELGQIMKFLNSDAGVHLLKDEALATVKEKFF